MLGGIAHWMHSQCHNTASSVQWLKIWLLFARWSVRIELSNYAFRQAGHMNNMKNVIGCCSPPSSSITAVIFSAISLTCSLFTAATANAVIDERGWHKGKLLGPHVYYTTWVWKEREREREKESDGTFCCLTLLITQTWLWIKLIFSLTEKCNY